MCQHGLIRGFFCAIFSIKKKGILRIFERDILFEKKNDVLFVRYYKNQLQILEEEMLN